MGPRNRRRLAGAAIGVAVVSVLVAGALLVAWPSRHATHSSVGDGSVAVRPGVTANLTYGMTKQQVLAAIGRPTLELRDRNATDCWQYAEHQKHRALDGLVHTFDATRVCFVSGRYALDHFEFDGRWDYDPPKIHVTS